MRERVRMFLTVFRVVRVSAFYIRNLCICFVQVRRSGRRHSLHLYQGPARQGGQLLRQRPAQPGHVDRPQPHPGIPLTTKPRERDGARLSSGLSVRHGWALRFLRTRMLYVHGGT